MLESFFEEKGDEDNANEQTPLNPNRIKKSQRLKAERSNEVKDSEERLKKTLDDHTHHGHSEEITQDVRQRDEQRKNNSACCCYSSSFWEPIHNTLEALAECCGFAEEDHHTETTRANQ